MFDWFELRSTGTNCVRLVRIAFDWYELRQPNGADPPRTNLARSHQDRCQAQMRSLPRGGLHPCGGVRPNQTQFYRGPRTIPSRGLDQSYRGDYLLLLLLDAISSAGATRLNGVQAQIGDLAQRHEQGCNRALQLRSQLLHVHQAGLHRRDGVGLQAALDHLPNKIEQRKSNSGGGSDTQVDQLAALFTPTRSVWSVCG